MNEGKAILAVNGYFRIIMKKYCLSEIKLMIIQYCNIGYNFKITINQETIGDSIGYDGEWIGVRGHRIRLIHIQIDKGTPGNIGLQYMGHLAYFADTKWVTIGNNIGERNRKGPLDGLQGVAIKLTGKDANKYDIGYNLYLRGKGETGFYKNGQFCGTRGESRPMEQINIKLIKPMIRIVFEYSNQTPNELFWNNGKWIGIKGYELMFERMCLFSGINIPFGVDIQYKCHLNGIGTTKWLNSGQKCGNIGEIRKFKGFAIQLIGKNSHKYDVIYKGYIKNYGETNILKNGTFCGDGINGLECLYFDIIPK
mmetsp:Transcript_104170/g.127275  ORF Transcript_104170/g.127275 Transcript_104170/m.127275 type:complete len:310 (-) Transcript_104170:100-1029(-)